ncbi:MAG: plasmid replication protein, CyRepA1 family, partial [Crocosphaera sp.]
MSFDEWQGNRIETEFLTYLASVTVNERYFSLKIPDNKLVGIKGVQGTGKTEMLVGVCAEAIEKGRPIFIISHLESLARALGKRLGVPYRTERTASGRILGYTLVADSLRPKYNGFDAEHWKGVAPLVILDECEQVIWHTLNGKTDIRQYRVKVLSQFQKLLRMAHQIILADADLSDHSIQFIQGLLEEKVEPYLIVNEYQHEGWDIFTLPSILEWHSNLIKKAKEGKNLFVLTAAQKPSSKNGTMAIENRFNHQCPWLKVLRIDKDTLTQKGHPACEGKGDFDALFKQYDVVVSSPSIVSGISLELKGHFDEVWGLSTGAITPTNFVQFLWRLRENVPRFIHVNKVSNIGLVGNGSTNPSEIRRSENDKVKLTLAALREFDDLNTTDIDALVNPICMKTWAKMG